MPVIVIGADTPLGGAIVEALRPTASELRAFVSDPRAINRFKERGIKVAIGDVSDGSHVGGAAMRAFCAVLVPDAATDRRERSFAATPAAVVAAWAEGLRDAGVHRVIWPEDDRIPEAPTILDDAAEKVEIVVTAGLTNEAIAAEIAQRESRPVT